MWRLAGLGMGGYSTFVYIHSERERERERESRDVVIVGWHVALLRVLKLNKEQKFQCSMLSQA